MTRTTPRHAFEHFVKGEGWVFDEAKARTKFQEDATVTDGVVRWNSNNNVPPQDCLEEPPQDCLEDFAEVGCEFDMEASVAAREADDEAFFADYRKRMANHVPSDEEMFEMRAAFGPGETVVNVITGQRIKL